MSKRNIVVVAVLAAAALGTAGFFIWRNINSPGGMPRSSTSDVESPKTSDVFPRDVKESDELETLARQALARKIPSGNEAATKELKDMSLQLEREPNYLQGWLQVGILRKFLGDYDGASLAWQYASLIRPQEYIAFSNLGDLYHYYLKDFPKAEKYLRRAVDVKPDYVAGYKNLFDLYTLSYKEKKNLAESVLLEGIKKNPGDNYLQGILTSYRAGDL
ncbi:hypothetical protein A2661_01515 [Candidatus Giovannonibacteria bacterium RIFCSPHIGHO2_01_FULL_45_24]|uniref:Uncharacterized protein n=1 Tax=Candidatus Giovannonibacteria bacterium RIFCSPLOWO2_01_FULL_46_32 TaxID=1798353 RepID=A0A1F5XHH4_9BACT|nr:MAG: hypothetical protein A2661_01515 [Candidatus Giovannonibacteria bacterium RIFCSPHIGHO2_01_FULL_45_24]OGF87246.1 MAG: hypothetical protein A3B19_03385 [Candidatus Giovannonibacteria bacterium RIFCSPLOWO2_01_FULL_46_32]